MPMPEKGVFTSKYYAISCPRCAAVVGRPCTLVTDKGFWRAKGSIAWTPHPQRVRAFKETRD